MRDLLAVLFADLTPALVGCAAIAPSTPATEAVPVERNKAEDDNQFAAWARGEE